MNQKEIAELRRRWALDKNAVGHIYGCFVNSAKQIVSNIDESLGLLPHDEAERYLGLLKKSMSGRAGKNLLDLEFSTAQVMNSEEHKLLMKLRNTELKDETIRRDFYQKIIDNLDMGTDNYLILLAQDTYDVPYRGKDDIEDADASAQVFPYFVCAICPVKEGKVALGYFPGDNEFHCAAGQTVASPELGFVFPAFDDRTANIYGTLYYSRSLENLHQEFIDAIFHTPTPMSAHAQRIGFQSALMNSLGDECTVELVETVYDELNERILEHKESKNPETLTLTQNELTAVLRNSGASETTTETFRKKVKEEFGQDATVNPANLMANSKLALKSGQATVTIPLSAGCILETRIIDGRKYVLIPAEELELNEIPVK